MLEIAVCDDDIADLECAVNCYGLEVILSLSIWREDLMTNNKKEDLKATVNINCCFLCGKFKF